MRVITARIPDELFEKIREIEKSEKIDRAAATRKLLSIGLKEHKRKKVVELLKEHKITYRKAAEMIGVSMYELLDIIEKEGLDIGYSLTDLEKDIEELK